MKLIEWNVRFWSAVVICCGLQAASLWGQESGGESETGIQFTLSSPPNGLTLATPLDLPLVADVEGVDSGTVVVEFLAGDQSLGLVDSPFNVLPVDPEGDDLGVSGVYSLTWEDVSVGNHSVFAILWVDGVEVARTGVSSLDVVAVERQTEVNLLVSDPTASETSGDLSDPGEFVIERSGSVDEPLEVFFEWVSEVTILPDLVTLPQSVVIPAGERSASVIIQPVDDTEVEGAEEVTLRLVPPICIEVFPAPSDCYLVGANNTGTVVIQDNDVLDENQEPLVFLVNPLNGQTFRAGADISLAAHTWDLDGSVATVDFLVGNRVLGTVEIESEIGSEEPVDGELPVPPSRQLANWTWEGVAPGRYSVTARATDDDGGVTRSPEVSILVVEAFEPTLVTIEAIDDTASEGNQNSAGRPTGNSTGAFLVRRTGETDRELRVRLSFDGTSTNGADYDALLEEVVIPVGSNSARIVVVPVDDKEVEGTETVTAIILASDCQEDEGVAGRCYVVGRSGRALVEIEDNDRSAPNENLDPVVAIIRPGDGSVLNENQTINLFAEATDRDGRVESVEFFANGESVGIVRRRGNSGRNRFFKLQAKDVSVGRYEVVAVATDDRGSQARSRPIKISVGPDLSRAVVSIVALDPVAAEVSSEFDGRPATANEVRVRRNTARFVVGRQGRLDVPLEVNYRVTGTATNGTDYRELSGTVSLRPGQTRAEIEIVPRDDSEVEGVEDVVLEVLPPVCVLIFPPPADCYVVGSSSSARVVIRDNDRDENRPPRIELTSPAAGDEFMAPARVLLQAVASDEDGLVRQVTFFANGRRLGAAREASDGTPADGETQRFELAWEDVGPGRYEVLAVAEDNDGRETRSQVVRIAVLEAVVRRTVVSVEALDRTVSEGEGDGPSEGRFRFRREGDLSVAVDVHFRLGGSAINGRDYSEVVNAFTFEPGEAELDFVIVPLDDNHVEGTEFVSVALQRPVCIAIFPPPPSCYELGEASTASMRIVDNDRDRNLLPRVAIVQPRNRAVFQQPANVEIRVEAVDRDGWLGHVALFAGDERIGEQSMTFIREPDPGQTQNFTLVWENAPAGEHSLTAVVTDDQGATSRSRPVTVSVVGEVELPVVTAFARDAFGSEPDAQRKANTATIRLRRTGKTEGDLVVFYELGGTAENGVDYEALEGSVLIPARKRWVTITVEPLADDHEERAESVTLTVVDAPIDSADAAYRVGRPATAGVVIGERGQLGRGLSRLEDGTVHVSIPAPNGKSFRVEAGSSLSDWDVIGTNTVTEDAIHIVDTESKGTTFRFFRIVPDIDPDLEDGEE